MPDRLGNGLSRLHARLNATASVPATYTRGSETLSLDVTLGNRPLRLDDGAGGIRLEWTNLEVFILAADFVLGGLPATPQRGDTVTVPAGPGLGMQTFAVDALGDDSTHHWCDPGRTMLRVHTKSVT